MTALRSRTAKVGIGILAVFVVVAVVGPLFVGDPNATNAPLNATPSWSHLLGTTSTGQDVFTQLIASAGGSLLIALVAASVATFIAVVIGVAGAVLGGVWDEVLSLVTNVMLVIPTLPLVIVLAGYLHHSGAIAVALVIAVTGWSWSARIYRVQALSIRRRDFVLAARATGESSLRIIGFEVLPLLVPLIAARFLGVVLYAIMTQAGLAFLGLGSVGDWTWGTMLYWANNAQAFQLALWWWFVPPGLCIAVFGTALVLLNSAIDSFADARLQTGLRLRDRKRRRRRAVWTQPRLPGNEDSPGDAVDGVVS
jgi:peptide/nickel transport system permease protein